MIYTFAEKTVKKYSQADVERQALALIKDKGKEINASRYLSDNPSKEITLTLVQLNEGVERLFNSSNWPY